MSLYTSPSPRRLRVPIEAPSRLAVVRRLLGDNTPEALAYAIIESRWEVAERCVVDGGLPPDLPNPDGQTPLVWSILSKQIEGVRLFIRLGADTRQLWKGCPLLHLAVMAGDSEITGYLLQQGADPDAVDERGHTALHVCAMRGGRMMANTLLMRGADKSIVAPDGRTAMDMWNDVAFHPLEYVQVAGVTLDHRSLFHWFATMDTVELNPQPDPDAVMEDRESEPGTQGMGATRTPKTHVPSIHKYRVRREEVLRRLAEAEPVGLDVPMSAVISSLRKPGRASAAGDQAIIDWVTFYEFSVVVLRCAAVM